MLDLFKKVDTKIILKLRSLRLPLARVAIFVVYFWFGSLKLLGFSPAAPLVSALFGATIHFMPFAIFYSLFALYEMAIGVLFLIPGAERVAIFMIFLHLVATIMPLFLLPEISWQALLIPTLEGQYMIKNILIASLAVVVGSEVEAIR